MKIHNPWNCPAVIVCTEKHGTFYYRANTEVEFLKSACEILRRRNQDRVYLPVDVEYDRKPNTDIAEEGLRYLTEGSQIHRMHLAQVRAKKVWLAERVEYTNWWNRKELALATNDGLLAWQCLQDRSGYLNEGVRLEPLL